MASKQELQVQQKREVEKKQESTTPTRSFLPVTDIFETDQSLTVVLEIPGVTRDNIDVGIENDLLKIEGRIDHSTYEELRPVYTEYNIGHYVRSFQISSKIDQTAISAELKDGVLTLTLPKAEKAKPRRIEVK
ncbi:Hsp20/alpha crystallin family protein [Inquilinus sp. OTU3971]|uniref:Hsp20/alpha crystallin family protein n=1 Tax=Inquilinus sp. OTU3971 TaxID=3043855 RepID=UPI00313AB344